MRFSLQREALLKPLAQVVNVVERRQTLPVLANLLLQVEDGRISLTGTDLEVEMIARADAQDTEAGETTEKALTAALRQLRERDYAAELRERGAAPIHQMAAVFEGKRVVVRVAGVRAAPKAKAKAKRAGAVRRGR